MVKSPYDRLFRRIFSHPQAGADLARNILPAQYLEQIDLDSIRIDSESYIDEILREHFTDLLMSFTKIGSEGTDQLYIYLLVDHKSSPEKWTPFQLLRYVGKIYQKIIADAKKSSDCPMPEKMPEVIPIIFYHGIEQWNYPLETQALIDGIAGGEHIPHFRPIFFDITRVDDEALRMSNCL